MKDAIAARTAVASDAAMPITTQAAADEGEIGRTS